MIEIYQNQSAYAAAGKPVDESRLALVSEGNEVCVDGVNVEKATPGDGDAVFIDADGNDRFIQYDTIVKSLIPAAWTHIGYAFACGNRQYKVLDKAHQDNTQWLAVWQYAITGISSTSLVIKLRMSNDYANYTEVPVTLTSAEINATSAAEISAAIAAKADAVETTKLVYHAFLGNADGLPDENGDRIIVQVDSTNNYQQSNVAATGCSIALSVWGDMPASSALWRRTGKSSTYGMMNVERAYIYYSDNGVVPTANVAVDAVDLVKKSAFDTSAYCAALREYYGDYRTYIERNMVLYPQKYGAFALIDADEMTRRYAGKTAVLKDGTTVYKYPALRYGQTVGYGTGKYAIGNWHLSGIADGTEYMDDSVMAKIREAQRRMNTTLLANNVTRWFAGRCGAYLAWGFSGGSGHLSNNGVSSRFRCQAVTLCRLK